MQFLSKMWTIVGFDSATMVSFAALCFILCLISMHARWNWC